jgi:hypothetical protein
MVRITPLVFLGLAGCATVGPMRTSRGKVASLGASSSPDASGVWDWVFRSADDQGDLRVEQEEWHLLQRGSQIEGYYDRAVTMMSTDERLFRCNQKLGFTKSTRVRIAGQVEGDKVVLREVAFEASPGPCDDGARNLVAYVGVLRGGTLALRWGPEAGQTLIRRAEGSNATLAQLTGLGTPSGPLGELNGARPEAEASAANASVAVDGTWEWELRSIDAEGDERVEREEWHITEATDGIRGYYDRTVRRVRADGVFTCNGQGRYETATRYTITGQRFGDKLTLTEIDYKAAPSGCDNALRRLDTYQGQLASADDLVLSWGPGNQLLRRVR